MQGRCVFGLVEVSCLCVSNWLVPWGWQIYSRSITDLLHEYDIFTPRVWQICIKHVSRESLMCNLRADDQQLPCCCCSCPIVFAPFRWMHVLKSSLSTAYTDVAKTLTYFVRSLNSCCVSVHPWKLHVKLSNIVAWYHTSSAQSHQAWGMVVHW